MSKYRNSNQLDDALLKTINLLIYLQDLVNKLDSFNELNEYELNKIAMANEDLCNAYIGVMRAIGLSNETLQRLGFDSCKNIKNIQIRPFLGEINDILATCVCDKQRAILVSGANAVHTLLDVEHSLKYAKAGKIPQNLYALAFSVFIFSALLTVGLSSSIGFILDGVAGAQLGAALSVMSSLIMYDPSIKRNMRKIEIARVKYTLARTIATFYDNIHAYKFDMPEKDLYCDENGFVHISDPFDDISCRPAIP